MDNRRIPALVLTGALFLALIPCAALAADVSAPDPPETQPETQWVEITDPCQLSELLRSERSDQYYQEAIVDPETSDVLLDGDETTLSDFLEEDDDETLSIRSAGSLMTYFSATPYEARAREDGTISVTSPYQTCRILLNADHLDDACGAEEVYSYRKYGQYFLQFADEEATQAAYEVLSARYGVENCFVDKVISADDLFSVTTSSGSTHSWGAAYMGMDALKERSWQGKVTVAIIDTGIDVGNAFFDGRTISDESYNFVLNNRDITDATGHGTHVAGIITDSTPDNVELMILRIFNDEGNATTADFAAAIDYAIQHGADVINASLGTKVENGVTPTYLDRYIADAYAEGIPICCAAGNSRADVASTYPACNRQTIAVSAIDEDGSFASTYSNYGSQIDFCAPGSNIVSANLGGGTTSKLGTSMAAPHLTAALAYLKLTAPRAATGVLYSRLQTYAVDLGETGKDPYYGHGCVKLNSLAPPSVELEEDHFVYDGSAKTPAVTVTCGAEKLEEGSDYTLDYPSARADAGEYTIQVNGKGNYSGLSREVSFTISPRNLEDCSASLSASEVRYNGKAQTPAVTVKFGDSTLRAERDYELSWSDNTKPGTASVTITGKGNFTGTLKRTFTIQAAAPAAPALPTLSNTVQGIKVTWKGVSGASGYRVYRKAGSAKNWTAVKTLTGTSWTDSSAKSGTTYTYTVRAYVANGKSNLWGSYHASGRSLTCLGAPTFSAGNAANGVKITWTRISGASGYRIYRKAGSAKNWTAIKTLTGTSWTDSSAKSGTTYTYTVRAYTAKNGKNLWGSYRTPGRTVSFVAAPSFSVTKAAKGVQISWKKVSGANAYRVYRKVGSAKNWTAVKTLTGTSWTDASARTGKYTYTVRANTSGGKVWGGYNTTGKSISLR